MNQSCRCIRTVWPRRWRGTWRRVFRSQDRDSSERRSPSTACDCNTNTANKQGMAPRNDLPPRRRHAVRRSSHLANVSEAAPRTSGGHADQWPGSTSSMDQPISVRSILHNNDSKLAEAESPPLSATNELAAACAMCAAPTANKCKYSAARMLHPHGNGAVFFILNHDPKTWGHVCELVKS